jgi:hypothetical protein
MVFGLFSKERALKRAMDKVSNKWLQSPDRFAAMEKLRDAGTDEALQGLCRRFSISSDKTIEDEQEKQWVVETLAAKGEAVIGPLHRYMKSSGTVAYPLRVLEKIASTERALEVVDDVLADEPPGYTRDVTRRLQIVEWLGELTGVDSAAVVERVAPYVTDFDENVRHAAVQAVGHHACSQAAEPLVAALLREEEESVRVKRLIAEVLCDAGLDLCGRKKEVEALTQDVLSDYHLRRDKLERRAS